MMMEHDHSHHQMMPQTGDHDHSVHEVHEVRDHGGHEGHAGHGGHGGHMMAMTVSFLF